MAGTHPPRALPPDHKARLAQCFSFLLGGGSGHLVTCNLLSAAESGFRAAEGRDSLEYSVHEILTKHLKIKNAKVVQW